MWKSGCSKLISQEIKYVNTGLMFLQSSLAVKFSKAVCIFIIEFLHIFHGIDLEFLKDGTNTSQLLTMMKG